MVHNLPELAIVVEAYRKKGLSVALCHGCFDLLHVGHVEHLLAASAMADRLVVTVTGDAFVNKGPGRPIMDQWERSAMLAALRPVDAVGISMRADAADVIRQLRPDVYVKGGDYADRIHDHAGFRSEAEAIAEIDADLRFTDTAKRSSTDYIHQIKATEVA